MLGLVPVLQRAQHGPASVEPVAWQAGKAYELEYKLLDASLGFSRSFLYHKQLFWFAFFSVEFLS